MLQLREPARSVPVYTLHCGGAVVVIHPTYGEPVAVADAFAGSAAGDLVWRLDLWAEHPAVPREQVAQSDPIALID